MCAVASAPGVPGAASVRVQHVMSRLTGAGTRPPPAERVRVGYAPQCHETGPGWVHIGDSGVKSLFHRG